MTIPTPEQTAVWTDADYFAFPAMNATALKQLAKNPMQYQHHLAHPTKKTPAMTMGSAIHCLTFEPDEFTERYAVWEGPGNRRTKAYREWAAKQTERDSLKTSMPERWRLPRLLRATRCCRSSSGTVAPR